MNWPVTLSYPTWVTCTGFSGAEMVGFFCEPTRLFMKPEKPPFLRCVADLGSLPSSEYLLGVIDWFSVAERPPWVFSTMEGSMVLKLAEERRVGLADKSVPAVTSVGGRFDRWGIDVWGAEMAGVSIRLKMAAASKGAPMKSSLALWLAGSTGEFELPLARWGRAPYGFCWAGKPRSL